MEERTRPNLWRRIAQLQGIALAVSGGGALVLIVVMAITDTVLHVLLYGDPGRPRIDLFLWPILFAASPLPVLHATQQCFRFARAATFVACGVVAAGLLGALCGLIEQQLAASPLSTPLVAAWLSAIGYGLIGAIGILVTAWIVEDENAPAALRRGRRRSPPPRA